MSDSLLHSGGMPYSLHGSIQSLGETVDLHKQRADEAEAKLRMIKNRLRDIRFYHYPSIPGLPITKIDAAQALVEAANDVFGILNSGTRIRLP